MGHTIQGKQVGNIGFGLMGKPRLRQPVMAHTDSLRGLTWRASKKPDEESFAVIKAALESGCNYMNGGEFYGPPDNNSLTLLNKYYERYPEDIDKIVLNIKGCILENFAPDASPLGVKTSVENCVRLIGGKGRIDQFEPARKDPKVDIETTIAALEEQVQAGNIGGISLSEVSAATIRRAAKVAKIESVEVELSLWSTEPLENGVIQACAELDIPILAYGKDRQHPVPPISNRDPHPYSQSINSPPRPRHPHRPDKIPGRHPRGRLPAHAAALPARRV